ncbi:uncharacterized protein LOC108136539 isoform X2 [Drosophila elegans]|uniref:uncharacterized protein LOC108136539 isoform X2 n=1 Tax=Drosophila elegans TaxID=30023 RepID=UPI001BC864AB|nr:uncharacterized protein LOC108136539 isoform X2 [Drosophila elegans]
MEDGRRWGQRVGNRYLVFRISCFVFVCASLRRQHSAGLAFLCVPTSFPFSFSFPWPTETLCSWLYRKRFAKHNMTSTRTQDQDYDHDQDHYHDQEQDQVNGNDNGMDRRTTHTLRHMCDSWQATKMSETFGTLVFDELIEPSLNRDKTRSPNYLLSLTHLAS